MTQTPDNGGPALPSQIGDGTPDIAARLSYRFADAMLAARKVQQ